jgi:5'(3')-deoxyribonucleotidase
LTVGIDLDGVLSDQITDVLPRIKRRLGIDLTYNDITAFRLPLGSTDLALEIQDAQGDASYLRDMPAHEGAARVVADLRRRYRVLLITARPPGSRAMTELWLRTNEFEFDGIVNAEETKKSLYGADVLIDDYTGNIRDFLEQTEGLGLLVDRPWNRQDRHTLESWIAEGRASVIPDLSTIPERINAFEHDRFRR